MAGHFIARAVSNALSLSKGVPATERVMMDDA